MLVLFMPKIFNLFVARCYISLMCCCHHAQGSHPRDYSKFPPRRQNDKFLLVYEDYQIVQVRHRLCPRCPQEIFPQQLSWHIITTIKLETQHYSPFRGRSFRTIPSLSRKCSNFTRDRSLVNTSTTCSSVLTYWSFMAPLCTMSRM
jgi:hypothetical protein